jgi:hypothetical protein
MIISNNLINKMPIADDAVIRINLAWIKNHREADKLIKNSNHLIYLDYPDGRKKPPKGKITLKEAIRLSNNSKVKYFAVSNCEDVWKIKGIIRELPDWVEFVPKIETETGVSNMGEMKKIGIKSFMLDKEDLYSSVGCDNDRYLKLVKQARKHKGVMELQGVVFI